MRHGVNDCINVGVIGLGGRGNHVAEHFTKVGESDNSCRIAAVCDVYQRRVTKGQAFHKCDGYLDYREVIERPDIDAVIVATPDHWHAKMALEAMARGKDVYCEKPMVHTIDETRQMVETVRKTQRVLQVGSQTTSAQQWWKARQAIAEGAIGHMLLSQGSFHRNSTEGEWNDPMREGVSPDAAGLDHLGDSAGEPRRFRVPAPIDNEDRGGRQEEGRPDGIESQAARRGRRAGEGEHEDGRPNHHQPVELTAEHATPHERCGRRHVRPQPWNGSGYSIRPRAKGRAEALLEEHLLADADALVVEDPRQQDDHREIPGTREAGKANSRERVPDIQRVPKHRVQARGLEHRRTRVRGAPLRGAGGRRADGCHADGQPPQRNQDREELPRARRRGRLGREPRVEHAEEEQGQEQERQVTAPAKEPVPRCGEVVQEPHRRHSCIWSHPPASAFL